MSNDRPTTLIGVTSGFGRLTFDPDTGSVEVEGLGALDVGVSVNGSRLRHVRTETPIQSPLMGRIVQHLAGDGVTARLCWDAHTTGNLHLYVSVCADRSLRLDSVEMPRVALGSGATGAAVDRADASGVLLGDSTVVGVAVKKYPWLASWNDVGAHGHRTLADSVLAAGPDGDALAVTTAFPVEMSAGQTLEAGIFLRLGPADSEEFRSALRHEVRYDHRDEVRYIPEGEFAEQRVWEIEDRWLGPPITEGALHRPYDQLITRPLGLNVLARRRFTWSNEDFSLWRLTGKEHYRDSGIKKAFALIDTQNRHGGWYEGVEFMNLPPKHHHMYDTYISGMFLLDAYDATGYDGFLQAAERAVHFWVSNPPPANGHVEVADGAWWYRWGGYINEFGYTDERCVLNTHSGATAFLAMYAERTGDPDARRGAEAGLKAMRWGLERGIQRGDGQFLYCLSQIDPTLERPGDPPYIRLDLVPQIEDVYTVASSYRLMMALRSIPDPVVTAAIGRALDYWWVGHRAGTVYTYRAYSAIAFGVAAGEIDMRYAMALPEILRDREQFTSMQRGLSSFIAPHGLPMPYVRARGRPGRFVEPVFVRRRRGECLFALVNTEQPMRNIPIEVGLPAGISLRGASLIDPAAAPITEVPTSWVPGGERTAIVGVEELQEFAVVVVRLELDEPGA
ncbi:MAG: hypothetical protein OXP08_01585 [bacterium]|nr:hypothetical protein [bacterium]